MSTPLNRLFGLQARRLADLIGEQGRDVYDALGLKVDAKWNSLIMALAEDPDGRTSSQLAARTGLSRQLVEARIAKMEAEELVCSDVDPRDGRRRLYFFTDKAQPLSQEVHRIMANFESVYEDLWAEIGVDLGSAVTRAEAALASRSLTDRYTHMFPQTKKSKTRS